MPIINDTLKEVKLDKPYYMLVAYFEVLTENGYIDREDITLFTNKAKALKAANSINKAYYKDESETWCRVYTIKPTKKF